MLNELVNATKEYAALIQDYDAALAEAGLSRVPSTEWSQDDRGAVNLFIQHQLQHGPTKEELQDGIGVDIHAGDDPLGLFEKSVAIMVQQAMGYKIMAVGLKPFLEPDVAGYLFNMSEFCVTHHATNVTYFEIAMAYAHHLSAERGMTPKDLFSTGEGYAEVVKVMSPTREDYLNKAFLQITTQRLTRKLFGKFQEDLARFKEYMENLPPGLLPEGFLDGKFDGIEILEGGYVEQDAVDTFFDDQRRAQIEQANQIYGPPSE